MLRRASTVAAVGLVALLGACGTENASSIQDSDGPVAAMEYQARCVAGNLRGVVTDLSTGTGARTAVLVVTNRGGSTCTLYGYGGLEFFDAKGKPNPTDAMRVPNPGPSRVVLDPGATAGKRLRWSVVPGSGEPATGPCRPRSTGVRVTPPDGTRSFPVAHDFGSVCSGGRVQGSAYFAQ